MRFRRRWSAVLSAGIVAAAAGVGTAPAPASGSPEPAPGADGSLMLVLDSSGSMAEPTAGGGTKIAAAKDSLRDVVRRLPAEAKVGLRVYGATVFDKSSPGACRDSQNVVPVGPLDREALMSAIEDYEPHGETPIGFALQEAARDLGPEGKRTIVLLSDGEPTCAPDPCEVARDLRRQGVGLTVNVVGLDVDPRARRALQCIARAGDGTYYDADDAEGLAGSLVSVSVRALREFSVQGRRVRGTPTPDGAPRIGAGQYVDTIGGAGSVRTYTIPRVPGETVWASVSARPPDNEENFDLDSLTLELLTPRGESCATNFDSGGTRLDVLGAHSILTTLAAYNPQADRGVVHDTCPRADSLVLRVERGSGDGNFAPGTGNLTYELLVGGHPRVTNVSALPPPVESVEPYVERARRTGSATPVVGGGSFNDAPTLTPGTYNDTIRPGEQLIYGVPLEWGQSLRFTATAEPAPLANEQLGVQGDPFDAVAFGPRRQPITLRGSFEVDPPIQPSTFYNGEDPTSVTAALPPVRYRNIETFDQYVDPVRTAGMHYVALQMSEFDGEAPYAAPLTIAVAVDGRPQGAPTYSRSDGRPSAAETDDAAADGDPTGSDRQTAGTDRVEAADTAGGSPVGAVVAVIAVLGLAGVGGLVLYRRRGSRPAG